MLVSHKILEKAFVESGYAQNILFLFLDHTTLVFMGAPAAYFIDLALLSKLPAHVELPNSQYLLV